MIWLSQLKGNIGIKVKILKMSIYAPYPHQLRVMKEIQTIPLELDCKVQLSKDKICHQAARAKKVLVLALFYPGNNEEHMARLLKCLARFKSIYLWIDNAKSQTGRQVKTKFGRKAPVSELMIFTPKPNDPSLNVCISGDSLKDVYDDRLEHAIRYLCELLQSTSTKDCQAGQGSVTSAQGKEEEGDSPNLEKMKWVKTMRQKRLTQEPAGDCFCIKVLLEDDREIKRNFPQNGTYQKKDEATEIFVKDDEVSFYGNFDSNQSLDATIPDENNKDHGEQRDKIEEDKIPSEEPEKKKKNKTRKRRKKKQIGSLQEGDEKICKSAEVANESKN